MKKVGVLGMTGVMGLGITQVCAQAGYQVVASSRSVDRVNKAIAGVDKMLSRLVEKGKMAKPDKDAALGRIKGTTSTLDFAECDLVIEVALEDIKLKKEIFAELGKICQPETILASNTSVLPVVEMAMASGRPDKVVGLHFFNPPPLMKLLEVVKTLVVSEETIAASKKFGESVGKTPIVVPDKPGFIVNRLCVPYILNAIHLLELGIAPKQDIDNAILFGLNHPIGPLALSDLIGNDVVLAMADGMYADLQDHAYVAPDTLRRMVSAGLLGRKTGKGFYDYNK
ncbi:MAG: 3-hydroxyacyl-CoA dehydrogenase NAD-binding domain-containing protein [Chloroflexota bacterium]